MTAVAASQGAAPLSLHPFRQAAGADASRLLAMSEQVIGFGTHIAATLDWVVEVGHHAPLPGRGKTARLWELLATTAMVDVGAARMLEPHLDALAILAQARADGIDAASALDAVAAGSDATWGVFAAEGPDARLVAERAGEGWTLNGTKPWCSLAQHLTHALVTAWTGTQTRRLFAVPLRSDGVRPHRGPWVSRGLSQVVSAPVDFDGVPAAPIGDDDWYLHRPGFSWGGMGVAAVWWGGAVPVCEAVRRAAGREGADQFAHAALGEADAALWAARSALSEAADAVDAGLGATTGKVLAERVRAVTADAVERVLSRADRTLGPGPLTADEAYARRTADLRVYVRQHHAERDAARLGRLLVAP